MTARPFTGASVSAARSWCAVIGIVAASDLGWMPSGTAGHDSAAGGQWSVRWRRSSAAE